MRDGWIAAGMIASIFFLVGGSATAQEILFESKRITQQSKFGPHIEGPAVDAEGNLYVPNFGEDGKIGKLAPGASEFVHFTTLNPPPLPLSPTPISIGNGIRFDREGRMYIADFQRHIIYVIERGETKPRIYFRPDQSHEPRFHQPNDLAIAADGTLYASDPPAPGRIWRITRGPDGNGIGNIMSSNRTMGTTNGLDLSPDGKTLYVSESNTRQLWSYRLDDNNLRDPKMVTKFEVSTKSEVDGLRTDLDGRIFLARPSAGNIAIITITPSGVQVKKVPTVGKEPTNLTFGGPDGKTVFVTQKDGLFIESFRTDRPGREPCLQVPEKC